MLRERVVSFDFSRILELCRREIFTAYVFSTKFGFDWAEWVCTGLDNLQKYYVTSITLSGFNLGNKKQIDFFSPILGIFVLLEFVPIVED